MTNRRAQPHRVVRRVLLAIVAASIAGLGAGGVGWVLLGGGDHSHLAESVVFSSALLMAGGVVGMLCVNHIGQGRQVRLMRLTAALFALLVAWWLAVVWAGLPSNASGHERHLRHLAMATCGMIALIILGQLLAAHSGSTSLTVLRRVLAAWVGVFGLVIVCLIGGDWWLPWSGLIIPIGTIIALATVLALAAAYEVTRAPRRQGVSGESIRRTARIRLLCPSCGVEQQLASGLVKCGACRRPLLIELEEPRCPCGYLLYQLAGDSCPECGKPVQTSAVGLPSVDLAGGSSSPSADSCMDQPISP